MDVVTRNFFSLLQVGAFGEQAAIEPLSAWKWNRLFQLSKMHGVAALLFDGLRKCGDQFFVQQMPDQLSRAWADFTKDIEEENRKTNVQLSELFGRLNEEKTRPVLLRGQALGTLYDQPTHRQAGDIDIYFPYEVQARKADAWAAANAGATDKPDKHTLQYQWNGICVEHHRRAGQLTNTLLNRILQNLVKDEFSSTDPTYTYINATRVETLSPALSLLLMLIRITSYVMNDGVSLKQLTDLGIFLRKAGHRVDFVKLENWIERLGLTRFAQLQGALLTGLLGFEADEVPFMSAEADLDVDHILNELFQLRQQHASEWQFEQGRGVFVHASNSSAMLWHVRRSARYFRYYPSESFTNFFANFAHSLSYIEE